MVELKEGGNYKVLLVKQGSNERGRWQLIKVADDNNPRAGAMFFVEPFVDGLVEKNIIRIDKFIKAANRNKQVKSKTTGQMEWMNVTDLTFSVTKVSAGDAGFTTGEFYGSEDTTGELPF